MADYAISNVPRRVVYANTGVGPYAFTFEILANTDIAVYRGSTLLTLTTDYSVTINANGTGEVTLVTAGTGNITIVGARAIQRTSDYTTGGDLFASTLNTDLDSLTIYTQQVAETAERGLKAPVVDPTDIAMTLPAKDNRKGKVLAFDSTTGNPVAGPALDAVTTVIAQSANINTVADNIASVNTVAGNTSNINTVAGVSSNVTTVAGSISNVNTVADDLNEPVSEINTVAVNIANVNAVGNNIANVNSVAGNETNINAVVSNATNINAVAGNASNINTVATNNANVTTVATNIANVNTNATNIANINQNAANIVAIQNASANATAAANSATAAASSATSASASAAAASAVALGNEPVRHSVRPSLLLDFANTKTLDPRITFTRASTATFYDGKTVAKAEENLILRSQEFGTLWNPVNLTVTDNTVVAPDGTTTAETITDDATSSDHRLSQAITTSANLVYTYSCFLKAGTAQYAALRIRNSTVQNYGVVVVDLVGGTITQTNFGTSTSNTGSSITSVGNGWYRVTVTASSVVGFINADIVMSNTGTPAVATNSIFSAWSGTGSTIYAWGAQLEQRSSVTAYTATTTAPITNYIPALQTAASGVARFEHNPVTGESLGLEIEEQRTNLLLRSEEYDNASWTKANANITTNTVVAPDGMLTADAMVETTASAQHYVLQTATATLTSALTLSIYAKLAYGSRYLGFTLANQAATTNGVRAIFNLSSGTVLLTQNLGNGTGASTSITHVGNGWYRCTLSGIPDTSGTTARVIISLSDSSAAPTPSYAGDGWSALYLWGAQLEAGSFATSYIKTEGSQVTRNADSASMTGTNFSSWFRADEGTLYADFLSGNDTLATRIFEITDSTGANRSAIIGSTGGGAGPYFWVASGNATQASTTAGTFTANTAYKVSGTYKVNDFAASINAGTVLTDSSGLVPNIPDRAYFGTDATNYMNGTIKKLAYYPRRLTNAELQSLTTI